MPVQNTYVVCCREVKKGEFRPEPGKSRFLKVRPEATRYAPDDALPREKWRKQVLASADGKEDEITGMRGDVLFFVHGYNNDVDVVLWRTRTLQRTLAAQGWRGLVVGFDWPSDNMTLNYLEDRSDAAEVALRLVDESLGLLVEGQTAEPGSDRACKLNVHLLGHSTGAYVIMEAFLQAQKRGDYFKKPWRIGQVAFIAGDVSSDSLAEPSDWSTPMFERIMRFTNYSNRFDKVLGVSNAKRLGTAPRAGRVGLPAITSRKAVNVDCSAYFATKDPAHSEFLGTFNHSWYIGDPVFALDLAMTLEGEIDREAIPTRRRTSLGLSLCEGNRPPFQEDWDAAHPPG